MKKNIIIAVIAAASALLLSVSCQKDDQLESQSGINGGKIFTASIEQSLTKTTLTSAYKVNWTDGDIININGVTFKATPDGTDATNATFAKDPDSQNDPTGETFNAIYPSTLYVSGHFELPATQTYSAGTFNAPMYAESETQSLTFKNICAVLAIKVKNDQGISTLKSIKVKADKKLNGTFTVASTTDGYKATIGTDGTEEVVLSSSEAITLTSEGTTFYIAIPEQEYSYLKIYLSEDGNLYKRAMITKKDVGTVSCNKIYYMDYQTNAVQLYADGPYWSTMNIGATAETGFGLYFGWGEKTGHALTATAAAGPFTGAKIENAFDGTYNFSTKPTIDGSTQNPTTLPASNDAATVNWGAAWKMPTGGSSGQFKDLKDNTTSAWTNDYNSTGVKGITFTGKTGTPDYSDITLFFPAAGYGNGTGLSGAGDRGYYWSSSLLSGGTASAYLLSFDSDNVYPQDFNGRSNGFPVRPVSD